MTANHPTRTLGRSARGLTPAPGLAVFVTMRDEDGPVGGAVPAKGGKSAGRCASWGVAVCLLVGGGLLAKPAQAELYRCNATVESPLYGTVNVIVFEREGPAGASMMPDMARIFWRPPNSRPDADFVIGYDGPSNTRLVGPVGGHLKVQFPREIAGTRTNSVKIYPAGEEGVEFPPRTLDYGPDEGGERRADVIFDTRTEEGRKVLEAVATGKSLMVEILHSGRALRVVEIRPIDIPEVEKMLVIAKEKIDARSPDACTNGPLPIVDNRPHGGRVDH